MFYGYRGQAAVRRSSEGPETKEISHYLSISRKLYRRILNCTELYPELSKIFSKPFLKLGKINS